MPSRITPHTTGPGFEITFNNGVLEIPDQQGAYLLSTGCGAGKTQSIKELIRYKQDEGVLYCVDTKSEADKMYKHLVDYTIVAATDILILHGDAKTELDAYRDHPENIMQKKVLIITHVRFWSDLIDYFLIYKPATPVPVFDGDFAKLMTRDDLRKWILFDETPMFYVPFATISRPVLGCLSEAVGKIWRCKSPADMTNSYMKFVNGTSDAFTASSHKLANLKRDVTLKIIPRFWSSWLKSGKKEKMHLSFYPTDICQKSIKTHILFYEGVGNILLRGVKHITLLDIPAKYNSTVDFILLGISPQKRSDKFDKVTFDAMIDALENTLKAEKGAKTLIVCWKNIGPRIDNKSIGEAEWKRRIDDELINRMFTPGVDYSITYFGAADTKSTNQYRDYQNIILLGDWNTPENFAASVREAFKSETTIEDYRVWYYTQLLCRIGIRKLNNGCFKVYYTNDYKPKFIDQLKEYLNMNKYTPTIKAKSTKGWLDKRAKENSIREPQKGDIEKLAIVYPNLKSEIVASHTYSISLSLDEVYEICPKKEKRRRAYQPLVEALRKLNVTLSVT